MAPFTRAIETICREIGVRCDGIYDDSTISDALPNKTSGDAILRMLKKSEPQDESSSSVVPRIQEKQNLRQSIVDLLRKEFEAVDSTPMAHISAAFDGGLGPDSGNLASERKQMQRGPSWGSPMMSQNPEEYVTFTKESLRGAIQSALTSDMFIDSVLGKLKTTKNG